MTYEEALQEINSRLVFGVKPGLERIRALCAALGDPQRGMRFVHVAGTNGKGTTSTLIASVLTAAGYKTGLYTSPYVFEFRERFRINGEMIEREALAEETVRVCAAADAVEAEYGAVTEFEFITALAFRWFQREACDFVVLEVGLGGRFDATNVIDTPDVAAICSISLDHTAVLGDTLEKIAFEKAGIIKPGGTVALYPALVPEARAVLEAACASRGALCRVADAARMQVGTHTLSGTHAVWDGLPVFIPFTGAHQIKNAMTALTALELLRARGVEIPDAAVQSGFAEARIPARMETLCARPLVLLDGGHNPGCAEALRDVLLDALPGRSITAIIGIMRDKDSMAYLAAVAPLFSRIIAVAPQNPRALAAEELAEEARTFCADVLSAASVEQALALAMVEGDEALVICGSFFLASEIRPLALDLYKK